MIGLLRKLRKFILPDRFKFDSHDGFWYDFRYAIDKKIGYFKGMLERAYEVLLFIPVIYNTVRWDQSSIFVILYHWLDRMQDIQRTDTMHVNAPMYADQLKTCVLLLKRIKEDDYLTMLLNEHEARWGKSKYWLTPVPNQPGYSEYHSTRFNIITPEDKELERKEYKALIHKEDYLYKQDIELLFNIIKKHHRSWWT